jgi:DNA-directed RNA polymerase II subunit RPB2
MYSGRTGHRLDAAVFVGPVYYMRLKHMVSEKLNYRIGGKVETLTRQPPKGRANGGGLRIGEMERDALLAHGLSTFASESFSLRSDRFQIAVRGGDGRVVPDVRGVPRVTRGDEPDDLRRVHVPFSANQLVHELAPLGVGLCFGNGGTLPP